MCQKLKDWLKKNDMSVSDLAAKAYLSRVTVFSLLKGNRVNITTAKKISKATKKEITVEDIAIAEHPLACKD